MSPYRRYLRTLQHRLTRANFNAREIAAFLAPLILLWLIAYGIKLSYAHAPDRRALWKQLRQDAAARDAYNNYTNAYLALYRHNPAKSQEECLAALDSRRFPDLLRIFPNAHYDLSMTMAGALGAQGKHRQALTWYLWGTRLGFEHLLNPFTLSGVIVLAVWQITLVALRVKRPGRRVVFNLFLISLLPVVFFLGPLLLHPLVGLLLYGRAWGWLAGDHSWTIIRFSYTLILCFGIVWYQFYVRSRRNRTVGIPFDFAPPPRVKYRSARNSLLGISILVPTLIQALGRPMRWRNLKTVISDFHYVRRHLTKLSSVTWSEFRDLIVLAPVCEEITCRGVILPYAQEAFGAPFAVLFSACVFSAYHLYNPDFYHHFLFGIYVGLQRIAARNIAASCATHAGSNFIYFVVEAAQYTPAK
jgi:membrane protease YdiL (CAAX protease family)